MTTLNNISIKKAIKPLRMEEELVVHCKNELLEHLFKELATISNIIWISDAKINKDEYKLYNGSDPELAMYNYYSIEKFKDRYILALVDRPAGNDYFLEYSKTDFKELEIQW